MSKIILSVHGNPASEFVKVSSLVFREQKDMEAYGLELGRGVDGLRECIKTSIVNSANRGQEVLVLADLTNRAPSNSIIRLEKERSFRHFAEVSSSLLLEVLNQRMSQNLASAIVRLDEVARRSIYDRDVFLSQVAP